MSEQHTIRVGITHGDINGIGYEVIIKAFAQEGITDLFTPVVFGHQPVLKHYMKSCTMDSPLRYTVVKDASGIRNGSVNFIEIASGRKLELTPGQPSQLGGEMALASLDAAADALRNRQIDVLVTAPINKEAMKMAGFPFPGHTEYIADRMGADYPPTMILMTESPKPLRVALQTIHIPLKDVADSITTEAVVEKLRSLNATLRKDFGIERPKIAVLSLNPHAGDNGAIGNEDQQILIPAVENAYNRKIMAFGPYAADGFFGSGMFEKFDAVLAMYHDQGLAPFKLLAMENGVNYTSGLPIIRTSPDHGTGYDIVGKDVADPTSMRQAIYAAIDILRRRLSYIQSRSNPLKRQYVDKSGDKDTLDLTKAEESQSGILL